MKRFISALLVVVMFISCVPFTTYAHRDISNEELLAHQLKELGLFRGVSDNDFALERAPSRVEALVMLIRVLGKENDVTEGVWRHPFTDVPKWADKYVGYAYSNGLTNGQSLTEFGTGDASAAMYVTFVLRALGYSDTNGEDFVWSDPFTLAREVGILSDSVNIQEFWRADVVLVSHAALSAYLNGTQQTLAQKLIAAEVFTKSQFSRVYNSSKNSIAKPTLGNNELSAEEIYEMCSPAVFYIEMYNPSNQMVGSGSGFFIDDKGTAVTNYHVIEGAYSAKAQMADTGEVYEILGVYDYNEEQDWAVIQVDCTENKYLEIGDPSTVIGGATVYTLGSPKGLQNTIAEGIISNPSRERANGTRIQISAPISHGSSGGALLNKMGHVIGITASGYDDAQNLNFAIPMTYLENHSHEDLTKLSELYGVYEEEVVKPSADTQMAYTLLWGFVANNYKIIDEQLGYGYLAEYKKENKTTVIGMFANNSAITLNIIDALDSGGYFTYSFVVYPSADYTIGTYSYSIKTENAGVINISKGQTAFECAEFNSEYDYDFIEYEGDDLESDCLIAKIKHIDGLNFINMIFSKYLSDVGTYGVKELGYTSFDEGDRSVYSNIEYMLGSENIIVKAGETETVTLSFECVGFPRSFDVEAVSENENIALVDFAGGEESLPWTIIITGVSPGTTLLKITNSFNDQYLTAQITIE